MIRQPPKSSIRLPLAAVAQGGPQYVAKVRDDLRDELLEYAAREGYPISSPSITFERRPHPVDKFEVLTMTLVPPPSSLPNFVGGSNDGVTLRLDFNEHGVPRRVLHLVGANQCTETYTLQGIETDTMRWTYHLTDTRYPEGTTP